MNEKGKSLVIRDADFSQHCFDPSPGKKEPVTIYLIDENGNRSDSAEYIRNINLSIEQDYSLQIRNFEVVPHISGSVAFYVNNQRVNTVDIKTEGTYTIGYEFIPTNTEIYANAYAEYTVNLTVTEPSSDRQPVILYLIDKNGANTVVYQEGEGAFDYTKSASIKLNLKETYNELCKWDTMPADVALGTVHVYINGKEVEYTTDESGNHFLKEGLIESGSYAFSFQWEPVYRTAKRDYRSSNIVTYYLQLTTIGDTPEKPVIPEDLQPDDSEIVPITPGTGPDVNPIDPSDEPSDVVDPDTPTLDSDYNNIPIVDPYGADVIKMVEGPNDTVVPAFKESTDYTSEETDYAAQFEEDFASYYKSDTVTPGAPNDKLNALYEELDYGEPVRLHKDLGLVRNINDENTRVGNYDKLRNFFKNNRRPIHLIVDGTFYMRGSLYLAIYSGKPNYGGSGTRYKTVGYIEVGYPLKITLDFAPEDQEARTAKIYHCYTNFTDGDPGENTLFYIKPVTEMSIEVSGVEFEGYPINCPIVTNPRIFNSHVVIRIYGSTYNGVTSYYYNHKAGMTTDFNRVWAENCTFKNIGLLCLMMRASSCINLQDPNLDLAHEKEVLNGESNGFDVGYNDIHIHDCLFDSPLGDMINFDGGKLRYRCSVHDNEVVNLNGNFFSFNVSGESPDIAQFKTNKPLYFYNNYVSTIIGGTGHYCTPFETKNHAAVVYNNKFGKKKNGETPGIVGFCAQTDHIKALLANPAKQNAIASYTYHKFKGRINSTGGYTLLAIYDIYSSVAYLHYYNNELYNFLPYNMEGLKGGNSSHVCFSLTYSKQKYEKDKRNYRVMRNNTYTWDEVYCKNILSEAYTIMQDIYQTLNAAGSSEKSIYESPEADRNKWINSQFRTSIFDYIAGINDVVFENNTINMPGGIFEAIECGNGPVSGEVRKFNNNTINCKEIRGALCRLSAMQKGNIVKADANTRIDDLSPKDWDLLLGDMPIYNDATLSDGTDLSALTEEEVSNMTFGGRPWSWFADNRYANVSVNNGITVKLDDFFSGVADLKGISNKNTGEKYARLINKKGICCRTKFIYNKSDNGNSWIEFIFIPNYYSSSEAPLKSECYTIIKKDDKDSGTVNYYILKHYLPVVEINNNKISVDTTYKSQPVILLKAASNMPNSGNDYAGPGNTLLARNALGKVTVTGNWLNTPYISDPGYAEEYTEQSNRYYGNAINKAFKTLPYNAGLSWQNISVRHFHLREDTTILLPTNYELAFQVINDKGNIENRYPCANLLIGGMEVGARRDYYIPSDIKYSSGLPLRFNLPLRFDRGNVNGRIPVASYSDGDIIAKYQMNLRYSIGVNQVIERTFYLECKANSIKVGKDGWNNYITPSGDSTTNDNILVSLPRGHVDGSNITGDIGGAVVKVYVKPGAPQFTSDIVITWTRIQ